MKPSEFITDNAKKSDDFRDSIKRANKFHYPKPETDLPKRIVRQEEYDIPVWHARRWSNIIAYGKLHDKERWQVLSTIQLAQYDNPSQNSIFKDDRGIWHYANELNADDLAMLAELRADTLDWYFREQGEKA